jgi:hypothetical protein
MKAGDVSGVRTSSQETWLSTPLSDPNAALWASITPPANPTLTMLVRRRAAAFSFDLLAQRLHLRFPETFASRATARLGMLGALLTVALGVGLLGYLASTPANFLATLQRVHAHGAAPTAELRSASSTRFVRLGETAVEPVAPRQAITLTATAADAPTERVIAPLTARAALIDADIDTKAKPVKAKSAAAKRTKSSARRATKLRRARVLGD